jgi:hypothetical protein
MMLTHPNECGQGNGNDAAGEGGRRGNSAINRGALHQGPNDPEVLLSALAFLHQNNFVIQSLRIGNKKISSNFSRLDRVSPYHPKGLATETSPPMGLIGRATLRGANALADSIESRYTTATFALGQSGEAAAVFSGEIRICRQ